jgi:hypothetical protein
MAKAITNDGAIVHVDDDVMGIVSEIRDRWPELTVQYLDPDRFPELTDTPYRIVEASSGCVVLGVWQLDRRVIDQLSLRDKSKAELVKLFNKEEELAKKKREAVGAEVRAENRDVLDHVFASPKGTYTFKNREGKKVTVTDG